MSSPSRSPRSGTRGYAHLVEINAPVNRVWRALTDPKLIAIWSGEEAEIDPRQGGLFRIGKRHTGGREAHIDVFEINRRLRLIYLNGPKARSSDSAIVDDFLVDVRNGDGTVSLRLLGSGIPEASDWDRPYMRMRMSWERFLARIKVTVENPPRPKQPAPPKDPPLPGLDY